MNPKKKFIIDELTPDLDGQLLAEASETLQPINSQALVQANIQKNIVIREELRTFIPPLLDEEYDQLEENILAEGCRDKLIVWKENSVFVLVDGHNRYTICNKHNIPYQVEVLPFKNIDEVQDWMINNQLGKRNVTEETKSYLRGMQYKREKQQGKRYDLDKESENSEENMPRISTRERLAIQHKVSPKTIQRDEKYVEVIDILSGGDKKFKSEILNRIVPIPKNAVDMVNNLNIEHIHKLGKLLKEGRAFKDCYRIVVAEFSEKQIGAKKPTALLDVIRSIKRAVQLKDRRSYEASLRVLQSMGESLF
jgi:hypothetical protein